MKEKRISMAEASRKVGKSQRYFANMRRENPDYFKNAHIKRIGNSLTILESDIEDILRNVKKGGVRVVKALTKWTAATKRELVAYPFLHYSNFCGRVRGLLGKNPPRLSDVTS